MAKLRLTKAQRDALKKYEHQEKQYDRYMGSVFVTTEGERAMQANVTKAYDACKALGMTYEHGL